MEGKVERPMRPELTYPCKKKKMLQTKVNNKKKKKKKPCSLDTITHIASL